MVFGLTDLTMSLVNLEMGPLACIPSGYVKIAIENGPFIVDFPIKNGDFP